MTDKATEIAKLLAPTVSSLGVELLGVEYLPSPGGAMLRLYIDVPADAVGEGGEPRSVTIDDCEAVSREVPLSLGGEAESGAGPILYRSIVLPLSEDDERIDHLLGAANSRLVVKDGD